MELERFICPENAKLFICCCCKAVANNPLQHYDVSCHQNPALFCASCVTSISKCPNCHNAINASNTLELSNIVKQLYGQLRMRCLNNGCNTTFNIADHEKHDAACPFRFTNCEYCNEGINPYDLPRHHSICGKYPIICSVPDCGVKTARCEMNQHFIDYLQLHIENLVQVNKVLKNTIDDQAKELKTVQNELSALKQDIADLKNMKTLPITTADQQYNDNLPTTPNTRGKSKRALISEQTPDEISNPTSASTPNTRSNGKKRPLIEEANVEDADHSPNHIAKPNTRSSSRQLSQGQHAHAANTSRLSGKEFSNMSIIYSDSESGIVVNSLAFCDDDHHLYVALSGGTEGSVVMRDTENDNQFEGFLNGDASGSNSLVFSNDHKLLFSATEDNGVEVWNIDYHSCQTIDNDGSTTCLVIDNAVNKLYGGSSNHDIKVWDISNFAKADGEEDGDADIQEIATLQGHNDSVLALAVSVKLKRLFSTSRDHTVKIWDTESNALLQTLQTDKNSDIECLALSDELGVVYGGCGGGNGTIKVLDMATNNITGMGGHSNSISCLLLSDNSRRLYSGSYDQTIKIWDIISNQCVGTLVGHEETVTCLALSTDEEILYSGSADNTLIMWAK